MQIEEAIAKHLLAQTDLTSLIGGRFYFDELPQQDTFPGDSGNQISATLKNTHWTECLR